MTTITPQKILLSLKCYTEKKCSSDTKISLRVCINYGNAYHAGCLKRFKNITVQNGYLIKCCDIPDKNNELDKIKVENENLRRDLAEIKEEHDKLKINQDKYDKEFSEHNQLKNDFEILQIKYKNLLQENKQITQIENINNIEADASLSLSFSKTDNNTCNIWKERYYFVTKENKLLIDKNELLIDKNESLQEKIKQLETNLNNKQSFSNIVKTNLSNSIPTSQTNNTCINKIM